MGADDRFGGELCKIVAEIGRRVTGSSFLEFGRPGGVPLRRRSPVSLWFFLAGHYRVELRLDTLKPLAQLLFLCVALLIEEEAGDRGREHA